MFDEFLIKFIVFGEEYKEKNRAKGNGTEGILIFFLTKPPRDVTISLAPIFPSEKIESSNRQRWKQFWTQGNERLAERLLADEGDKLGFSPAAFTPFFNVLKKEPVPLSVNDLNAIGLSEL